MTLPSAPASSLLGSQRPSVVSVPPWTSSLGQEAVELAASAGLYLDPWQVFVLEQSLGLKPDRRWASFEVKLTVPRQNGKGSILEARELAGLFLFGERFITHSAHLFDTSLEAYRRLRSLIEESPDLLKRVKRFANSHGDEGIELRTGQRIRFRTRTKGGGRGFTGDLVILDEDMFLSSYFYSALLPTVSARSVKGNPQIWYAGSPVDQMQHDDGIVAARIRERALAGGDTSLSYFEWSAAAETPNQVTNELGCDPEQWARANPGLGIRISAEHVALEMAGFGGPTSRGFAVERLGVGDWPPTDASTERVIDRAAWDALTDPASHMEGPVCFAFDVTPDRSTTSIAAAGTRGDSLGHVEIVEAGRGTGWVVDRLIALTAAHANVGVMCDAAGPAASLLPELEKRGVTVTAVNAKEHAAACGMLYDAIEDKKLRHLGTGQLSSAIVGAVKRPLGDAWAWSRKNSTVDISPLVAATLAFWGSGVAEGERELITPIFV